MRPACCTADVHIMNFLHAREIGLAWMQGRNHAHHDPRRYPNKTTLARNSLSFCETTCNLSDKEGTVFKPPLDCLQLRPCTALPCDTPDKFRAPSLESLLRTHRKTGLPCRG